MNKVIERNLDGLFPPVLLGEVGIPVKVNIVSGGKPNGVPERR